MMSFGYELFSGRLGASGYARESGTGRTVTVRGLAPGVECQLFAVREGRAALCGQQRAGADGQAQFTLEEPGRLFAAVEGQVRLWQGGEEAYLQACALLRQEKQALSKAPEKPLEEMSEKVQENTPNKPPEAARETVQESTVIPAAAETETAPQEAALAEKTKEPLASVPLTLSPQPLPAEPVYSLRPASAGEPVDALPALFWPQAARQVQAYFDQEPPCAPFHAPGWRFVRAESTAPGIPFFVVGYLARDSRVRQIAYALPGGPHQAPSVLPGYQFTPGRDGYDYWVLRQELGD